jgi:hypothetical protein
MVTIAGNVAGGQTSGMVSTQLTVAIDDNDTTITVTDTTGFPNSGILVIGDEHILYSNTTATTFVGTVVVPMVRGAESTTAIAHGVGTQAQTKSGAMLNNSASYNIAVMADASGLMAFIAVPLAFFRLIGSFLFLPIQFLGTDLQILTYLWGIVGIGMLAGLTVSLAGGRRV